MTPTSKYPVLYISASKGAVPIESLPTPHLANAWRKLCEKDGPSNEVAKHMHADLVARGCTYDMETSRWTFPPRPGDDVDREGT